jgi:hypothetical protein
MPRTSPCVIACARSQSAVAGRLQTLRGSRLGGQPVRPTRHRYTPGLAPVDPTKAPLAAARSVPSRSGGSPILFSHDVRPSWLSPSGSYTYRRRARTRRCASGLSSRARGVPQWARPQLLTQVHMYTHRGMTRYGQRKQREAQRLRLGKGTATCLGGLGREQRDG